jgi:putative oxidoreductase
MFKALENAYEFAALPLRIGLAALLITVGVLQVMDTAGTTESISAMGFPAPMVIAIIIMVSELVCGSFILLGLLTRLSALWIAIVLTAVTIMMYCVHFQAANITAITQNVAVIGGAVCLMLMGPNKWSLDEKYFWE